MLASLLSHHHHFPYGCAFSISLQISTQTIKRPNVQIWNTRNRKAPNRIWLEWTAKQITLHSTEIILTSRGLISRHVLSWCEKTSLLFLKSHHEDYIEFLSQVVKKANQFTLRYFEGIPLVKMTKYDQNSSKTMSTFFWTKRKIA